MKTRRTFSAHETEWMKELDGVELAGFSRRALAFFIDWTIVGILTVVLAYTAVMGYVKLREMRGIPEPAHIAFDAQPENFRMTSDDKELQEKVNDEWSHILLDVGLPVLYFGLLTWQGKGRSPGKRITRIRVVSVVHPHLTLWHSVERALGYGAALLEGGFGFVQFFIHPYRRCAQDRLAETIVVTEAGYRALQMRLDAHGTEAAVERATTEQEQAMAAQEQATAE